MAYYIKDTILPIDEDETLEFKAHRNFSSDEVPAWRPDGTKICPSRALAEFNKLKNANRTRQPISRNICGFLNSGKGGTILVGVLDSGKVVGLVLSSLQKDHLLLSLEDALRRFKPRVPLDFVRVSFIPVLENEAELLYINSRDARLCEPPKEIKQQPHQLRTSSLCWCDVHAMQRFKFGFMPTQYVVEVRVAALHPAYRTPEVARALEKLMADETSPLFRLSWPAFTSEDGNLFVRVLNSLVKYTKEEITSFNKFQTEDFIRSELAALDANMDNSRLMRLQSIMAEGVVVSKPVLRTILEHAEPINVNVPPVSMDQEDSDSKHPGTEESERKDAEDSTVSVDGNCSADTSFDVASFEGKDAGNVRDHKHSPGTQTGSSNEVDVTHLKGQAPKVIVANSEVVKDAVLNSVQECTSQQQCAITINHPAKGGSSVASETVVSKSDCSLSIAPDARDQLVAEKKNIVLTSESQSVVQNNLTSEKYELDSTAELSAVEKTLSELHVKENKPVINGDKFPDANSVSLANDLSVDETTADAHSNTENLPTLNTKSVSQGSNNVVSQGSSEKHNPSFESEKQTC